MEPPPPVCPLVSRSPLPAPPESRTSRTSCLLALIVILACSACASRSAPPRYPGAIRPPEPDVAAPDTRARSVVESALALRGSPYREAGTDPSGFDCSGFVQYVFAARGIALPRSVREQYDAGKSVDRDELAPGDLVFFRTVARGASHVGIIVDDDLFVHAPSGGGVVRTDRLSAEYWDKRYLGARRVYKEEG